MQRKADAHMLRYNSVQSAKSRYLNTAILPGRDVSEWGLLCSPEGFTRLFIQFDGIKPQVLQELLI